MTAASLLTVSALVLTGCVNSGGEGSSNTGSTAPKAVRQAADDFVKQGMAATKSTEALVGVWMPDGSSYLHAYGNDKLTPNAPVLAGETTAPAMCAVLLQLAQRGQVPLKREVVEDLARQVGIDNVTYESLCNGTSGLADYKSAFEPISNENPARPWNARELISQGLMSSPLPGAGEDTHISNTDPVLLARALRARTGQTPEDLLKDYVFGPAKMNSSDYLDQSEPAPLQNTMQPLTYNRSDGKPVCENGAVKIEELSPSLLAGAGGTITTLPDLHRFYVSFFNGSYGGKKLFEQVTAKPRSLLNPERDAKGKITKAAPQPKEGEVTPEYVWGMQKMGPVYGRTGSLPGTMTAAYIEPKTGLMVAVAFNNTGGSPNIATSSALGILSSVAKDAKVKIPWTAESQSKQIADAAICRG